MKKEEIKQYLLTELSKYSNEKIEPDQNIFSYAYNITPRDMVYTIVELENLLHIKIVDIFKNQDSNIMTINNITESVMKILMCTVKI